MLKLKSRKMRISAPAHPSATGGRVSGLVFNLRNSVKESLGFGVEMGIGDSSLQRGADIDARSDRAARGHVAARKCRLPSSRVRRRNDRRSAHVASRQQESHGYRRLDRRTLRRRRPFRRQIQVGKLWPLPLLKAIAKF